MSGRPECLAALCHKFGRSHLSLVDWLVEPDKLVICQDTCPPRTLYGSKGYWTRFGKKIAQ